MRQAMPRQGCLVQTDVAEGLADRQSQIAKPLSNR
jgi:hypothetical protein